MTTREILPPVNPFLGLLPAEFWNRHKDFFTYFIEWLPATASVTTVETVPIQADADFLLMGITAKATATDNTTALNSPLPFLLTLEDSASGRTFSAGTDGATGVHLENITGTAQLPFYLPYPKLLRRNGILTGRLQNLSATDRNVRVALIGFKVFPEGFQP
jgi:hypothetical protein